MKVIFPKVAEAAPRVAEVVLVPPAVMSVILTSNALVSAPLS
ncbi:hypothetical protein HNP65_000523 [Thermosipho japonicus]|uniref:Uncharacterized protein n=1 Tax=Thermosipho japonicus TaxID=90323 RepID=A0A841GU40_9BACT|nr:hypothetical protein [Thermosipho japonicus]